MTDKKKKRPKWLIALFAVMGVVLVAGLTVFLIAHFYISKLNLVTGGDAAAASGNPAPAETQFGEEATQDQIDGMQQEIENNISGEEMSDPYQDGVLNVLVIGSDTRITGQRGRSDSMVLVSVNRDKKKISVISFMRDIYLQIPGHGYNRLNAAYAFGGAQLLLDTIQLNFKIKIEKYVEFDFYSFIEFVDALGGVTVNVKDSDLASINQSVREVNHYLGCDLEDGVLKKGGLLTLNGKQTLGHVRNRSYANGDFTRTENQREVISQLFSKAFRLSLSEANDLLCTYLPQVTTNLTEGEIMSMLVYLPDYGNYSIGQLCVPLSDSFSYVKINGMSVLRIDFQENIGAISKLLYGGTED